MKGFESSIPGVFPQSGRNSLWNDINAGAISLAPGAAAPDRVTIGATGLHGLGFNGTTTTEELEGAFELDHGWKEGTPLKFHVHWMPDLAAAGNVKWQLEYFIVSELQQVTASTVISVISPSTALAWQQITATFPDIVTTGVGIGAQFVFRLFRNPTDAQDTYASDAVIHGTVGIHAEFDAAGSRQVYIK